MKKFFLLSIVLTAISLILSSTQPQFFETLERKLYDLHLNLRGPIPNSGQLVIVTIDEKSLQELGRWPWPRSLFVRVFDEMLRRGARLVFPDIFFTEKSPGAEGEKNDRILAQTLAQHPEILLGYYLLLTPEELKESAIDKAKLDENFSQLQSAALENWRGTSPVPEALGIQDSYRLFSQEVSGARRGYFNHPTDPDGTSRSASLLVQYRKKIFPSLPLQTLLQWKGEETGRFLAHLPIDPNGNFLINFRGPGIPYDRVSAPDLLSGNVPYSLQGKIVLFGAIAAGLEDNRPTPVDTTTPSVVLAAHIIDNLLAGDFLRRNQVTHRASQLMIILIGLTLGFFLSRLDATRGFFIFLGLTLFQAVLIHFAFRWFGWVLESVYPLFSGFLVYGGTTLYRYLTEEKEKQFIQDSFQHYLSADVVRELVGNPDKLRLGGERKELTVFFSDIRDFASIVETTPAETLVSFLNSYLTPVTDLILDHQGLLDKYIGDAVMAVFGAPLPDPDHPRKACETAVKILRLVDDSQEKWQQECKVPQLKIGIGINTGTMTVGNMGSERRFDYTVMGDAVNLASRLEGLNKYYGTRALVSQTTYQTVKNNFLFRELDQVHVKGKKEIITLYELLPNPPEPFAKLLALFGEALALYRKGDFLRAKDLFEKCLGLEPTDGPSRLFLERCQDLEKRRPDALDGITSFLTK